MTLQEYLKKIQHLPFLTASVLLAHDQFDTTLRVDYMENKSRLCTYEINYFVTHFDCVFEKVLRVSCFSYEFGIPLYSDPPSFDIAVLNPAGFGYIPNLDWEKELVDVAINPDIIKKIKSVLQSKPPIDW